jgi:hypothetical protein
VTIEKATDYISKQLLKQGCILHKSHSITTSSVYIKIDYGVGGYLRISDHKGKGNVACRFNLQPSSILSACKTVYQRGVKKKFYYGSRQVDHMIKDIIAFRNSKIAEYGESKYAERCELETSKMKKQKERFWMHAVEITPDIFKRK